VSSARKTPTIPISRTRKEIMYSFTRSLIGPKLARMQIHVRVVDRTTSASEMPSIPSLYWMPNAGIQSATSTSWKPAASRSNPPRITKETIQVASATTRAVKRMARRFVRGRSAMMTMPSNGRNVTRLSQGSCGRVI
jgi:hypothetical protein